MLQFYRKCEKSEFLWNLLTSTFGTNFKLRKTTLLLLKNQGCRLPPTIKPPHLKEKNSGRWGLRRWNAWDQTTQLVAEPGPEFWFPEERLTKKSQCFPTPLCSHFSHLEVSSQPSSRKPTLFQPAAATFTKCLSINRTCQANRNSFQYWIRIKI